MLLEIHIQWLDLGINCLVAFQRWFKLELRITLAITNYDPTFLPGSSKRFYESISDLADLGQIWDMPM